jgi:hypothetical protein
MNRRDLIEVGPQLNHPPVRNGVKPINHFIFKKSFSIAASCLNQRLLKYTFLLVDR